MKKRFLSIILTLAMVLTIMPGVAFADEIKTIADVLNTVSEGFPINEKNAWIAENGQIVYDDGDDLCFVAQVDSADLDKNIEVTSSGSNYITNKATFNMESGKLVSISFNYQYAAGLNGTYCAPVAKIGETKYKTVQEAVDAANTGDSVILLKDVTLDAALTINNEVVLDLDGHVLSRGLIDSNGPTSYEQVIIIDNGNLTLKDSNTNNLSHKFKKIENGNYKGLWVLDEDFGTEIIKGGCITGGSQNGILIDSTGNLLLNGGNIIGNYYTGDGGGVCINSQTSSFTMNGGKICGNLAYGSAGVCVCGTFNMNGGLICNNIAEDYGGGILINDGVITMLGGEISDNTCGSIGGGIDYYKGNIILGGTAKIKDNYSSSGGSLTANNLYFEGNYDGEVRISFASGSDAPAEGMEIGVSLKNLPTDNYKKFTNDDSNTIKYIQYFFSDNKEYLVDVYSNCLALTDIYPLYVGGINVNVSNKNDVFNDDDDDADDYGSVHYDPITHILTLNNAKIQNANSYNGYGIATGFKDLTIKLKGDNQIGNIVEFNKDTTIYRDYSIRYGILGSYDYASDEDIKCDITFTGDGNLTIYDYLSGIYAKNITFDENFTGKLKVEDLGAMVGAQPMCAIHAIGDVTIKSGSFDLTSYYSSGIQASGNVVVTGNVDIEINDRVQGINANNIEFYDNFAGTVKIVDEGLGEYEEVPIYVCAINASNNVTIGGGTFDLTSLNSNGINAGNTISVGGENTVVKAKGGNEGKAIIAGTKLDIDTGKLSIINGGEYIRNTTKVLNPADATKKDGYVIIAKLYSVTFNENGHGNTPSPQSINVENGGKIKTPDPLSTSGYTFGGWYKDAACTQAWNFEKDTVTNDITLYAKWIENAVQKAAISGNVTEEGKGSVSGATVELLLGAVKVAATVTDDNGRYTFNNVENGKYNIVVTKADDSKTKTELVDVNQTGEFVKNVILPSGNVNSKVEHKGAEVANAKSDISQTVVGGLDEIANNTAVSGTDKITIKLTVEPKQESAVASAAEIKKEAGSGKKVEFLDMSLWKQVTGKDDENIGAKNDTLLTIVIPFDFTDVNVSSVMILRKHGTGNAEKLKLNPDKNQNGKVIEEGFTVDKQTGTITIYAKNFSDYALAYDEQTHSGGGGGSSTKPTPVVPETGYVKCTKDNTCPLYKFTDLKTNDWYHDGIHFCLDEGLMKGISATKFDQAGNTSRAMMMTIVARMGGAKCDSVGPNWYLDGVNYVKANKISDGSRPTDMITREEFAVMLYNFAKTQGKGFKGDWVFPLDFKDANKVSGDAHEAMCWCVKNKILNGRGGIYAGMLDPKGRLTRAEASAMIQRYYEVK